MRCWSWAPVPAGHPPRAQFAYWLLYHQTVKICCDKFHFPNHANNKFCKDKENCLCKLCCAFLFFVTHIY